MKDSGQHFVFMLMSVVCTAFILLAVDPALARPVGSDIRTVIVETSDLDLSRPADQKTMASRIRSAERTICGSGAQGIEAMIAEAKCVNSLRRSPSEPGQ
jgi:UrcA family protein